MERKKWADIAKCFAIIAVVVGHTSGIHPILSKWIFSFHMPLFFIMSGYFMRDTADIKKSVKKDAKGLLLPYTVTCGIITVLAVVLEILRGGDIAAAFKVWIPASAYGSGGPMPSFLSGVRIIGALWFLLGLFFAKLIIYLTQELGRLQWIALLIIGYIGYATTDFLWLPFSIQAGMCAACYVYMGKLFNKYNVFEKTFNSKKISLFISVPLIWLFIAYYSGQLYMVRNFYGYGLLDVIGSICAVFSIVWISMLIEKYIPSAAKLFSKTGSHTLVILCTHITEMNVFPWQTFFEKTGIVRTVPIALAIRFAIIFIMCLVLRVIPIIKSVYYPKNTKKV